ncbi:hypothetical protein QCA50_011120 [Cerrena zonata]|uniref:Uncharacterized protein n=1 Tax=Cerrena zonata TaxID=2478898 RepID=A0AAW0G389_9APHY
MESGPSTSTGSSTPRPQAQPGPIQQAPSNSSTKSSRAMEKEKADDRPKASAAPRGTRYKDKFNALREKYEAVTAQKVSYAQQLAVANDKIRKLQNECNLLLDAVDIAAPSQENISYYLSLDPVPPQYDLQRRNLPGGPPPPEPLPVSPPHSHSREITNGTNGHSHRR